MRPKPKFLNRLVRYHPFGEGHEQAHSEHKEKPVNTQVKTRAKNGENAFLLRVASVAKCKCDL